MKKRKKKYSFLKSVTTVLPDNKNYSYPWFGVNFIESDFKVYENIRFMDIEEDVNLGWRLHSRLGWSSEEQSATSDSLYYDMAADKSYLFGNNSLLRFYFRSEGFWNTEQSQLEDSYFQIKSQWFGSLEENSRNYLNLSYINYYNQSIDEQVILDGANGMRGYPANFLSGNESLLLQYERRLYTDWHWFQLARVGLVGYLDVGKVWEQGNDHGLLLADIGFGLRMISSRAFVRSVVHFDIAFPIEKHPKADDWLISFTVKEHF